MNGGGPTAQIVERGTWKANRDFVGHKKAVSCARFCGKGERLFEKFPPIHFDEKIILYTVVCISVGMKSFSRF